MHVWRLVFCRNNSAKLFREILEHNLCAILVVAARGGGLLQRLGKPSLDRWERHILRTLARQVSTISVPAS